MSKFPVVNNTMLRKLYGFDIPLNKKEIWVNGFKNNMMWSFEKVVKRDTYQI
jgi:hypothetical protein